MTGAVPATWTAVLGWTLIHFLWQGTAIALALAMALAVLPRRVPIISGARSQPPGCRGHLMKGACDRAGDVERSAAQAVKGLGSNQRNDEQDETEDDARDHRQETEEQPVLRSPRPAGTRGRHRLFPR